MAKQLSFLIILLILISPISRGAKVYEPKKYILSLSVKKSSGFSTLRNRNFYQAFVFGNKANLYGREMTKFKELGLMHLMTPSGLHLSSLMFVIILFRRKFKFEKLSYIEQVLTLAIYVFTPSFFALRRVAFLYFLKSFNDTFLKLKLSQMNLFALFILVDISVGTYAYSILSFCLSILFILIFKLRGNNKFYLMINLFLAQILTAYIFSNKVGIFNIILSPLYTALFTFIYPLLVLNYFFLEFINYSDFLISTLRNIITLFHNLNFYSFDIGILEVIICVLINRKNFLLFIFVYLLLKLGL